MILYKFNGEYYAEAPFEPLSYKEAKYVHRYQRVEWLSRRCVRRLPGKFLITKNPMEVA